MSLKETVNGTTLGDRILFILLLIVSFIGIFFMKEVLPQPRDVTIEVEGKLTHRYPLDTDRRVEVGSPFGHLTLEIKDRKARVTGASCPNKLCELQGWISRGVIICLPGRITVTVGGSEEPKDRKVDAITG
ncbi:MAG: NusG domain II-containing protein [Nitrospirae bacterium]|nr:NusG domain II-containing protein [Nitrospirota bacterium]MCL5422162.1 NusG domain II-containing protein [Nitrospirota bacterium]